MEVYYYKARWYDPALRRFLQPDTIVPNASDPQSLNRYSYAANSPIGNSDPTGHAVFSDVGAHLLYNPVNNNVMIRDISGSAINRVVAQASVGSASASDRLAAILAGTMGFFGWQRGFFGKLDTLLGEQIRTQFRGAGGVVGDAGFAPEFQDDHWYAAVWGNQQLPTSRQTGHFLTAVRMGAETDRDWIRAIVGHEQWSDKWSKGGPVLQLALKGHRVDQDRFVDALAFDASGQVQIRDALLLDILSPERHGALDLRQGNSVEDLRLSARGWRLGRMVAEGSIHTNKELANWIALNVAGD